jgi:hypothetical protein
MADEVIAKYKADLKDYNSQIDKGTKQAQKDFDKVDESASGLNKTMGKLGAAVAAAFAVDRIVAFTAEASKLAAEGEGVRRAFERIGDPKLLQGLRDATRGTVSDLELMKSAVRASNFKIPLQDLAKLFEFARRRAKETGEEVDYLVNSIVLGIGRKSPLILDNLGISAVELRKKLKGVGVEAASVGDISKIIGEIATEEMRKMGNEVVTTKDRMDQLAASTANFKEKFGAIINENIVLTAFDQLEKFNSEVQETNDVLAKLAERYDGFDGFTTVVTNVVNGLLEPFKVANRITKEFADNIDAATLKLDEFRMISDMLSRGRIDEIQKFLKLSDEAQEMQIRRYGREAEALDITEDALRMQERLRKEMQKQFEVKKAAQVIQANTIKNAAYWAKIVKDLQAEQMAQNTTLERQAAIIPELSHAMSELNRLLGKAAKSSKAFNDTLDKEDKHNVEGMTGAVYGLADALKEANKGFDAAAAVASENQKQMDAADEQIRIDNKVTAQRKQNFLTYVDAASSAFGQVAAIAMEQTRQQVEFEQNLLNQKFQQGLLTEEEFTRQSGELKRKQAQQAKDLRLFETIINTASGIVSALAQTPPNVPQSIATGVAGALQAGLIASQPIPQFARGTLDAPAGFKIVGEEGPELIYDGGGYPVITHEESMKILEKYHIPTVDIGRIESGGFEGMAESAKLNGFNDMNLLQATDRLRQSNKQGFVYMADRISESLKKSSRNEW